MEQNKDINQLAMFCHLAVFIGGILPLSNYVYLAWVYNAKAHQSELLAVHAKQAFNFQLTLTLIAIVMGLLPLLAGILGIFLIIYVVIEVIIAAIKAHNGKAHRYRLAIPFLKN